MEFKYWLGYGGICVASLLSGLTFENRLRNWKRRMLHAFLMSTDVGSNRAGMKLMVDKFYVSQPDDKDFDDQVDGEIWRRCAAFREPELRELQDSICRPIRKLWIALIAEGIADGYDSLLIKSSSGGVSCLYGPERVEAMTLPLNLSQPLHAETRFSLTFPLSDYFRDRERNLELETLTLEETPEGDLWRWTRRDDAEPIRSEPPPPEAIDIRRQIAQAGLVS